MTKEPCPLTPTELRVLQASLSTQTSCDKELAILLYMQPGSVKTFFKRISAKLGTDCRFASLMYAFDRGWIQYTPLILVALEEKIALRKPASRKVSPNEGCEA